MTLHLESSPETTAWLDSEAQHSGTSAVDIARRLIERGAATASRARETPSGVATDPTIALIQSWIAEDATDDEEEIREAEADLVDFKRNMNATRKAAGERLLYPEVEWYYSGGGRVYFMIS